MNATKNFAMLAPCPKCPFRTDVTPYITAARARSICSTVNRGASFHCHKTVKHDADGAHIRSDDERMCAGAVILARKEGTLYQNQMARIAERLGANFDDVTESAPIYDSADDMVRAHAKVRAESLHHGREG